MHDPCALAIRHLQSSDSIAELTGLLHIAYADLTQRGMRFLGSHQDEAKTRERVAAGECYVATKDAQIVGTILWRPPHASSTPWYNRPEVASLHQLAVHPAFQKQGLGSRLLTLVEARTASAGARELALDTAEPAHDLIAFYQKRGYRFIEYAQWSITNYRSVILSKCIAQEKSPATAGL
jgi:GNAT superfamily N-acetyltransferase